MKMIKPFRTFTLLGIALLLVSGCGTHSPDFQGLVNAVTNLVNASTNLMEEAEQKPETNAPAPIQSEPNAADLVIAAGAFVRPVIAVGPDGTLFVAAEGPGMASVHLFVKPPGSAWSGGVIVQSQRGGPADASRVYSPDIAAGKSGQCWVSMRCGTKEWGSKHGPAFYIRRADGTGKWTFLGLTTGAARLAVDPADPDRAVLMTKNGAFALLDAGGAVAGTGAFQAGGTGEKFAFDIDAASIWHTAVNGYSAEPSPYNRTGGRKTTWADYGAYGKWYGNDLCYPSICAASGKAYIVTVLGGNLRIQVMDAGAPRYPIAALPGLGTASLEQRCPPRLVKAASGVAAVWRSGKAILMVDVEKGLKGAKPVQIAAGEFPDVTTGPDGWLHLVYVADGALRYKAVGTK